MKKFVFSVLAASTLLLSQTATDAQAAFNTNDEVLSTYESTTSVETSVEVEQVAASKATAKSGTFKTKYNTNVRQDAGTKYKVVTLAKAGTKVTATHQKKVGKETWYKVKANGKAGWVLSSLLTSTSSSVAKVSNTASASTIVSKGLALQGIPYKFGGTTTAGFDCSGFTQYVFKQAGKSISRTTTTQFAESTTVSTPQAGDLVFFANTYRAGISHVGIYIGNNQFVHAGGSKAEVVSLSNSYWGPKFHSFKRIN